MGLGFNSGKVATQDVDSGLGGGYNTVWDDVTTSLVGKRLYSVVGTIDYDYDNAALKFQQAGDLTDKNNFVIMNVQYPHKAVLGSGAVITPHIHFVQPSADNFEFSLAYRVQNNGEVTEATWITLTADTDNDCALTYPGTGDFNNILKFGIIDASSFGISATIQFKLTRTDSNGVTSCLVTFFDFHAMFDTMGSFGEYTKRSSD